MKHRSVIRFRVCHGSTCRIGARPRPAPGYVRENTSEPLFPAFLQIGILQSRFHALLSQFLQLAVAARAYNIQLQSADKRTFKQLGHKPIIVHGHQKRQHLVLIRRSQPLPIRKQLLGRFRADLQSRSRGVQQRPPHFNALYDVAREHIIQDVLPRQVVQFLRILVRDLFRIFDQKDLPAKILIGRKLSLRQKALCTRRVGMQHRSILPLRIVRVLQRPEILLLSAIFFAKVSIKTG